jgi:hypothetical protein
VQLYERTDWVRMSTLLHSAVYVGGGLYFDKPNTEGHERPDPDRYIRQEETPFRLATLEEMASPVDRAVQGRFCARVFSPLRPLEDPAEAFAFSLDDELAAWARARGREVGAELVASYEQGMAGNIRAEWPSALVRAPLVLRDDGSAAIPIEP